MITAHLISSYWGTKSYFFSRKPLKTRENSKYQSKGPTYILHLLPSVEVRLLKVFFWERKAGFGKMVKNVWDTGFSRKRVGNAGSGPPLPDPGLRGNDKYLRWILLRWRTLWKIPSNTNRPLSVISLGIGLPGKERANPFLSFPWRKGLRKFKTPKTFFDNFSFVLSHTHTLRSNCFPFQHSFHQNRSRTLKFWRYEFIHPTCE